MLKKIWEELKGFIKYLNDKYESTNPYEDRVKVRSRYEDDYEDYTDYNDYR